MAQVILLYSSNERNMLYVCFGYLWLDIVLSLIQYLTHLVMYITDNGCRPHSLRAVTFGTCLLRQHTRLQKLDCTFKFVIYFQYWLTQTLVKRCTTKMYRYLWYTYAAKL